MCGIEEKDWYFNERFLGVLKWEILWRINDYCLKNWWGEDRFYDKGLLVGWYGKKFVLSYGKFWC